MLITHLVNDFTQFKLKDIILNNRYGNLTLFLRNIKSHE